MEKNIWITYLQRKIKENEKLLNQIEIYNLKFFLFGSAKIKGLPNDLDILLIYDNQMIDLENLLNLKKELMKFLFYLSSNIEFDLTILSIEEEAEINFIKNEEAIFIIGKT
ncbi:hypothetical protein ACI2WT_15150 [Lysinibacillus fusiformis]